LIVLLAACRQPDPTKMHAQVKMQRDPSPQTLEKRDIPARHAWLKDIKTLSQMFRVVGSLRLEPDQSAVPGHVIDLVRVADDWFLLDIRGEMIFHYDGDGNFLGPVGQQGQGPGEFARATALYRWRDKLLVVDSGRAQYLVYELDGTFVRSISSGGLWINSRRLITTPGRFYILGFFTASPGAPYHAILSLEGRELSLVTGFGERHPAAVTPVKRDPRDLMFKDLSSLAHVNGRIWVGSPYGADIEIFDEEGRLVERLQPGVDGISRQEMDGVRTESDYAELLTDNYDHSGMAFLDPWVIAYFTKNRRHHIAQLFDSEGTLVNSLNVEKSVFGIRAKSVDGLLVYNIRAGDFSSETLIEKVGAEGYQLLIDAGFKPEEEDDAVYLLLSQVQTSPPD
jgi:hypothetical protein